MSGGPGKTRRGRKPGDDAAMQPAKRRLAKSEPLTEVPAPPDYLGEKAKEYWLMLASQLVAANLLTSLHLNSFAVLCETYQEYRTYADWLAEDPTRCMFTTENGYQQETPQVRMRDRALASLHRLWPKFGLTPAALAQMRKHAGVTASKLPPVQDFARKKYEPND